MDIKDLQGKTVHYSIAWEEASFTGGFYNPGKSFRLYCEAAITLVIKGVGMNRSDAVAVLLSEGYHNFIIDEIVEAGSDPLSGVLALF